MDTNMFWITARVRVLCVGVVCVCVYVCFVGRGGEWNCKHVLAGATGQRRAGVGKRVKTNRLVSPRTTPTPWGVMVPEVNRPPPRGGESTGGKQTKTFLFHKYSHVG